MVHGLVSTPDDETKERVSVPFWACAGALAPMAMAASSAKPNTCDFMAIPFELNRRFARDYCIIAQRANEISTVNCAGIILQSATPEPQSGTIISQCVNL